MISREIKSLTGIRGLAAIYVMIFHWNAEIPKGISIPDSFTANLLLKKFLGHGYLSVDLFFILSGFVLCLSSSRIFADRVSADDYRTFMFKRFSRIFPLYSIITLLYFFLFHEGGIAKLLMNLTLLHGANPYYNNSIIPPGWSLTNEWLIYFIFPFFLHYLLKIKKTWILLLISFLILVLLSSLRSAMFNWANYSYLIKVHGFHPVISFTRGPASILRAIVAYLLGAFSFLLYKKNKEIPFLKFLMIPLFALLFISKSDILIILSIPLFIIYLTKENLISRTLSHPILYFPGLISYSLYVNHYLFIKTYRSMSNAIGVDNNILSFGYVLIGTFLLSTITYYIIEKPGLSILKWSGTKITNSMYSFFNR